MAITETIPPVRCLVGSDYRRVREREPLHAMSQRFNLLADPRFESLRDALRERIRTAAGELDAGTFGDFLDPTMRGVVQRGFSAAGAHEGTIWLLDPVAERLVMAYNTGPNAGDIVGKHYQPLFGETLANGTRRAPGIVSGVFLSEQPFCENFVYRNVDHDATLNRRLAEQTFAMIVVPFYFAGEKRGVMSCVQLTTPGAPDPSGFPMESVMSVQFATEVLGRLLDYRLVGVSTGWLAE